MLDADAEDAMHGHGDCFMSPEVRLLYEVVALAALDLQSPDEQARKEAHLFFTAPSGGWASMRRLYLDALGIDENYLLRKLGLELQPAPDTPPPARRPTPPPRRRYQLTPKERRPPPVPREAILAFVARHDHVTPTDLKKHFGMSIQIASARMIQFMNSGHLERPSRGVYRIARKRPPLGARLLDARAAASTRSRRSASLAAPSPSP